MSTIASADSLQQTISIIIPVLHEPALAKAQVEFLLELSKTDGPLEIIVVDGSPAGESLRPLKGMPIRTLTSPPGRAIQMNAGAVLATGPILLFLHVDTWLPPEGLSLIRRALRGPIMAGAFDLSIDSSRLPLKWIARVASLRSRLTRVPYGDQAMFIHRNDFFHIGQFAPIPIMEDVEIMTRIRQQKKTIVLLQPPVRTSARRWEKEGIVFGTLRNWLLRLLYHLGVHPKTLARVYRPHQETPRP